MWKVEKSNDCYAPTAMSPDGKSVVLAGVGELVAVNVDDGKRIYSISFPEKYCVKGLSFVNEGSSLVLTYQPPGSGFTDEPFFLVLIDVNPLQQRWHVKTSLTHLLSLAVISNQNAICLSGSKVYYKDDTFEFRSIVDGHLIGIADSSTFDDDVIASPTGRFLVADGYFLETPQLSE